MTGQSMTVLQLSGAVSNELLAVMLVMLIAFMLLDYKIDRQFRKLKEELKNDKSGSKSVKPADNSCDTDSVHS